MHDLFLRYSTLRRPGLLVRAARFGLVEYRRDVALKRVLKTATTPKPKAAVDRLLIEEARLEEARLTHDATYNVTRHVEVLICLMGEVQLLEPQPQTPVPPLTIV